MVEIEIPGKAMEAHTFAWVLKFTRYGKRKQKTDAKMLKLAVKLFSPNPPTCSGARSTPMEHSIVEEHYRGKENTLLEKDSEKYSSSQAPSSYDQWLSSKENTLSVEQLSTEIPSSYDQPASTEKYSAITTRNTTSRK